MMNDQFERIMRFAQRTGDRVIVTDPSGKEPVVIMPLDAYEALVDGALGPGDFTLPERDDDDAYEENAYGEPPTLEIIEEPVVPPAAESPVMPSKVAPAMLQKTQEIQRERGEEQFYLEPLG